jgi:hypothetical protein
MCNLPRVRLVGGVEFVGARIGVLEVDIHDRQLVAKAELGPPGIGDCFIEDLSRGPPVANHFRPDHRHF